MKELTELETLVDARTREAGLDLTTGGEPTFTVPFTTEPEWRTEALGPDKRARAAVMAQDLARRIRATVAEVPGRKYDGEDVPRWCLRVQGRAVSANVIPDPGVVELNLPPARRSGALRRFLSASYAAADAAGLAGYRVLHNGRVLGSGGGAHVTLGGPTFGRSPFVARPGLLPDLVAYVHNHPGLSYAFVGLSAGPTSQAPRVDEGGVDRLRDLRIALGTLRSRRRVPAIEDVHATLAPLMADATGNTHRAELNVEKLLTLGLVELRAVEAPPTADLWATTALVWRALVARLAARPYREAPVEWGTSLHDEWALPSRMARDLDEVLGELGLPRGLLSPHIDHRYPVLGTIEAPGVRCEVRQALEFWPVIGPLASLESASSRPVDSSVDRIELRLSGPRAARMAVLAGGRAVPLARVGAVHVGAVRYRAGYPMAGGLAPLVPHQAPLELVLAERGKLLGAARIHPWRPGGGAYDGLPRDLEDAAERRSVRFERFLPSRTRGARPAEPQEGPTLDLLGGRW